MAQGAVAGGRIDSFPNHWLLLRARARTGASEVHELWTIVVRSGRLTLIVGSTMIGKHSFNKLCGGFHGTGLTPPLAAFVRTRDRHGSAHRDLNFNGASETPRPLSTPPTQYPAQPR